MSRVPHALVRLTSAAFFLVSIASVVSAQTPAQEPTPPVVPVNEPAAAPAPEPTAAPTPPADRVRVEARRGRGITVTTGDSFALTIRPRIQLRATVAHGPEGATPRTTLDAQPRTMRLWLLGHVASPKLRYGMQLAFGTNDFERVSGSTRPSPIFDAFLESRHLPNANVRVGQFFVPFDRLRTIREFALQTVDRTNVIRELTLDRDVGIMIFSEDVGGHGGKLAYHLGVFAGDGRNAFDAQRAGVLTTARLSVRPFGSFDDDQEGDVERRSTPRLAIGLAGTFDHRAVRAGATTGAYYQLGTTDYVHGAVDLVFKQRGFAFMAEGVVRGSPTPSRSGTVGTTAVTETPGRGVGYVVQASYNTAANVELWLRWDELRAPFTTSTAYTTLVANSGRTAGFGVNYYLDGHSLKLQADAVHTFGGDASVRSGTTTIHLQVDATF